MDLNSVNKLIDELRQIQEDFCKTFEVTDIITNSKIFEILIADNLDHLLIPGHSGSRDAKDEKGGEFEYKHFKESSSNHSWTFNDYSDTTIEKLKEVEGVIFAHINDEVDGFPEFDWYYKVPGEIMSKYLEEATVPIANDRKMINVSPNQIQTKLKISRTTVTPVNGKYYKWIKKIVDISGKIEKAVGTKGILTSNKFWEVLVALKLNHKVESEQAKHDAVDDKGNTYEYKVAKNDSWSFQDISDGVLKKYLENKGIILAIVDKEKLEVVKIYEANPGEVVKRLKEKLQEKEKRYRDNGKEIRRKQVNLSHGDLQKIKANEFVV